MPKRKTARKKARVRAKAEGRKAAKTGLLDAAAAALRKAGQPMSCPEMIEAVLKAGTWRTAGRTPAATLSAAIHREIRDKGKEARFVKSERGQFRLRAARSGKGRGSA